MLAPESILKTLGDHIEEIRKYGVKKIALFGSYAKGEQIEASDIDILVEFEEGEKTFDNYMELKFYLEDLFGCEVDLVIVDAIKPDLRPYILGSAKYVA